MPKRVSNDELATVQDAITDSSTPLSLEEIAGRMSYPVPRRTLQRRLAQLVEQGKLAGLGDRGGRRYRIANTELRETSVVREDSPDPSVITLSMAAEKIRSEILRPLSVRRPVGYQSSFLEDYQPNVSAYLTPSVRRKLLEMGKTSGEPLPAGTHFRKVMSRLLIDLSWNSSRLEGNTYSLLETQRLLEIGEMADGKKAEESQMILNHKAAIEMLAQQADEIGFNRYTICNLHAQLSDNLLPDPAACGRLRSHAVAISGTVFHPLEVPQLIEARFELILAKAAAIEDAFEQAFFVMVHIPYLQPFEDVNKRVSRLAANIPLVRRNLSPLSFVDVSQRDYVSATIGVYELNRVDYLIDVFVWAYERSCARYSAIRQSLGEPDTFRLRHRQLLIDLVAEVIRSGFDKKDAAAFVRRESAKLPEADERARFASMVETELASLHEGNFARYRVRPSEFEAWEKTWR